MNRTRIIVVVAAFATLAVSVALGMNLGGVGGAHSSTQPDPGRPAWVTSNGGIDISKVPAWMPVFGLGPDPVGFVKGPDSFATDGRPVYLYDRPNGNIIGRADQG
jgi:hypothetical protein